jgi:hypothetical protein
MQGDRLPSLVTGLIGLILAVGTMASADKAEAADTGTVTPISLFCGNWGISAPSPGAPQYCVVWNVANANGNSSNWGGAPSGYTLVITDMECTVVAPVGENGRCDLISLVDYNYPPPFPPTLLETAAAAGPHGWAVAGVHLTTGIAFSGLAIPEIVTNGNGLTGTLQGYLMKTPTGG